MPVGELRIAKGLPDAQTLAWELQDFRGQIQDTDYIRFAGARDGKHDDLVLALAIGCGWASKPVRTFSVGTYYH